MLRLVQPTLIVLTLRQTLHASFKCCIVCAGVQRVERHEVADGV